jgi:glycosyltransferase involved in cell wall biosynthesis
MEKAKNRKNKRTRFGKDAKVSVLVPVFNEAKTVAVVLKKLILLDFVREIIAVDDGSTDNSLSMINSVTSKKLKVISLAENKGKTNAIKKAIGAATGDIIIIQDADLEYNPEEIYHVIEPILTGVADVVYGSRFLVKKASRVLYFYHYVANKFLTYLSNLLTNLNLTDIETCYKCFWAPILKNMPLTSNGFGLEVEITAMISKMPLRIYEVPISYYGRTYEEGKKIELKDGIHALWYVLYYNLIAPRFFKRKKYFAETIKILR